MVRDFTLTSGSDIQQRRIVQALKRLAGVTIVQISDRILQLHRGGKIEVQNKFSLDKGEVLAMAYTLRKAFTTTRLRAKPWPSSPMEPLCLDLGTSVGMRRCR